jgi:predicted Zn-dependent protease
MIRAMLLSLLILGVMGGALSGCATGPAAGATDVAADVLLPPRQEELLGRRMRGEVIQQLTVLENPAVQQYIDQLGAKVVRAAGNEPEGIRYTFTVVKGEQINAFTTPGGDIYVFTGLLKAADNEAELVSVLAHEVAHVTERHIAEKLVATYGLQTLIDAALGQNAGMLAQLVASLGSQGYLLRYSREQESQSDRSGIRYMTRAGYNPEAFITFFQTLQRRSGGGGIPEFLSSHPSPANRISQARSIIRQMNNRPTELGAQRYQQMLQQL